jgi:biopolymer transport protein ExbD
LDAWDVFHTDRLESQKGLNTAEVRAAIARGDLREDDLARPSGSTEGWRRIGELAVLMAPGPEAKPRPTPPPGPKPGSREIPTAILLDDLNEAQSFAPANPTRLPITREDRREVREQSQEIAEEAEKALPRRRPKDVSPAKPGERPRPPAGARPPGGAVAPPAPPGTLAAPPAAPDDDEDLEDDPLAQDAEAADFTLAPKGGKEREEDLDLAAMVDVAFQLIMFFIVTAASVFFKSMEIPAPNPDKEKTGQQAVARTIEDLSNENILVEIDKLGQIQVDHKPVAPENLIPEMRRAREETGRLTMLLMADLATPHKNAVAAYDAANEIGLTIKVGKLAPEE